MNSGLDLHFDKKLRAKMWKINEFFAYLVLLVTQTRSQHDAR